MSSHNSASVFFGTWVPRRSKIGERLEEWIDKQQGAPAATNTPGVTVGTVGSDCGPESITINAGKGHSFGYCEDGKEPVLLSDAVKESRWKDALTLFFAAEGIDPSTLPPVGWYFAGSIS